MDLLEQMQRDSEAAFTQQHAFESIDAAQLAFDSGLEEVVLLADDAAFNLVRQSMDYMHTNGEFERVQRMAMEIGAMACMYDHMQGLSQQTEERYSSILTVDGHDDHGHDHDKDSDDSDDSDDYEFTWVNGKFVRVKKKKK